MVLEMKLIDSFAQLEKVSSKVCHLDPYHSRSFTRMALKFVKNNNLSSPTTSSPEKMPNSLTTNLRMSSATAGAGARNVMQPGPSRNAKRGRESSEEENSSDEDHIQVRYVRGANGLTGRGMKRNKRMRTGDHKWDSHQYTSWRNDSSSEEEDEEEEMTPSPLKRTGLNIETLSLMPPTPISSEYTSVNGFLKMLHFARETPESRGNRIHADIKRPEARIPSTLSDQKPGPAPVKMADKGVVVDESEKDAVTGIYEEANRALGRLMLDRRRNVPRVANSRSEDEDSGTDYSAED